MTTASGTITFHYDENNNVTYETDQNGNVVASYTFKGNQPVSMTRGGQTYYYQLNGHGDVIALTDANGNTVATYEYDAFGNIIRETGTIENPYRYAGYRYDKETGLYYLQSRYYDPGTGRFLTRDTFEGFDKVPLNQNRYIYTHNNPVKFVDPNGKWAWIVGAIFGGIWGAWQYHLDVKSGKIKRSRKLLVTYILISALAGAGGGYWGVIGRYAGWSSGVINYLQARSIIIWGSALFGWSNRR